MASVKRHLILFLSYVVLYALFISLALVLSPFLRDWINSIIFTIAGIAVIFTYASIGYFSGYYGFKYINGLLSVILVHQISVVVFRIGQFVFEGEESLFISVVDPLNIVSFGFFSLDGGFSFVISLSYAPFLYGVYNSYNHIKNPDRVNSLPKTVETS